MVVIQIQGGLGNQMFQYALGLQLQKMGRSVRFDYASYDAAGDPAKRFYLPVFGINCEQAGEAELRKLGQGRSFLSRIGNKLGLSGKRGSVRTAAAQNVQEGPESRGRSMDLSDRAGDGDTGGLCRIGGRYEEDLSAGFHPEIFDMEDVYLSGYWQSERYFAAIREEVADAFRFPDRLDPAAAKLRDQISSRNAVSVHIRRGDYLALPHVYGGICTQSYYQKAMEEMRNRMENPVFFVFSDDPEWVKENRSGDDVVAVDGRAPEDAWMDMYLMTQCRANIIANSSFSWWGAWLNPGKDKIVLSPARWFANHEAHEAICRDWITIEG